MAFVKKNLKGMLLCLLIAVPAWFLGKLFPVIGGAVIAIVAGMVVTVFLRKREALRRELSLPLKKYFSGR